MGTRSTYSTIARVIHAFTEHDTWTQSALATHVGVQSRTLRTLLVDLQESGMPLHRDEEHPHVYWTVPRGWFPGGVVFEQKDWAVLVDAIARVPNATRRSPLLRRLLAGNPAGGEEAIERLNKAIVATSMDPEQHSIFLTLQEAILKRQACEMKYYSNQSRELAWRTVTPQRLIEHPRARLVAYCHRRNELRWFRLSNIQRAHTTTSTPYVDCDPTAVEALVRSSVDGYHDGSEEELSFVVRDPEARWVRDNLLSGMRLDEEDIPPDGIRVVARGAALVVARFVAGLGGAARADGEEVRALVRHLAAETLEANA